MFLSRGHLSSLIGLHELYIIGLVEHAVKSVSDFQPSAFKNKYYIVNKSSHSLMIAYSHLILSIVMSLFLWSLFTSKIFLFEKVLRSCIEAIAINHLIIILFSKSLVTLLQQTVHIFIVSSFPTAHHAPSFLQIVF